MASLELARRPTVRLLVTSAGTTTKIALTERHADLVELLVRHPLGLDAQALMGALAGATTPVTVRAEMSRLRRKLGGLLWSRPYRLTVPATVRDEGPWPASGSTDRRHGSATVCNAATRRAGPLGSGERDRPATKERR